jgi:hypothetical protein
VNLSLDGLKKLCRSNIVELKFNRRLRIVGKPSTRRMLATLDAELLNSTLGKEILNFKPPSKSPAYNAESKGLLTVWDILFQDWRNIPVNATTVVSSVPTKPVEKFWEYFDKVIGKMTATQKAAFMDK